MDTSNTIRGLSHEDLANLQRIHPADNQERGSRRRPERNPKHRERPKRGIAAGPTAPTYTPDGHVADHPTPHHLDLSA